LVFCLFKSDVYYYSSYKIDELLFSLREAAFSLSNAPYYGKDDCEAFEAAGGRRADIKSSITRMPHVTYSLTDAGQALR
jgi:hypothetical protein